MAVFISFLILFITTCPSYFLFYFFLLLLLHPFFLSLSLLLSSLILVNYNPTILLLLILPYFLRCVYRDSSAGEVTRLRTGNPRNPLSIPNSGNSFFSFPKIPEWLWSPLCLVLSGHRERFPRGMEKSTCS